MNMADRIDLDARFVFDLHNALGDVIDAVVEKDCGLDLDRFKTLAEELEKCLNASEGDPPYFYVSPRWRFDQRRTGNT